MARHASFLIILVFGLAVSVATCEKLLVLVDDQDVRSSHAQFLSDLDQLDVDVEVQSISDSSLRLKRWDEWIYDKLVILGGTKGGMVALVLSSVVLALGEGLTYQCY